MILRNLRKLLVRHALHRITVKDKERNVKQIKIVLKQYIAQVIVLANEIKTSINRYSILNFTI